jgi:hypothetical protein
LALVIIILREGVTKKTYRDLPSSTSTYTKYTIARTHPPIQAFYTAFITRVQQ